MRTLLYALAGGMLLLPAEGTLLRTDYGRQRTLRTTSELELDLETDMEMTVDGEPSDRGGFGGGMSATLVRKSVVSDEVLEGAAGEPRHVRRSFEALRDESSMSFGMDDRSDAQEFPLEGVTLELTLDEDGEVEAELVEGPEPDDSALLEGHALALALDAFLPAGEVEEGASWDLDDETLRRALGSALDERLFPRPAREDRERGGGGDRGDRGERGRGPRGGMATRLFEPLEWEGTARVESLDEEHEGVRCARIAIEIDAEGTLPEPDFGGRGRGFALTRPLVPEGSVQVSLEGELLFALESGMPMFLELDGLLRSEQSFEREREGRSFSSRTTQTGQFTLTVTVEEQ